MNIRLIDWLKAKNVVLNVVIQLLDAGTYSSDNAELISQDILLAMGIDLERAKKLAEIQMVIIQDEIHDLSVDEEVF